MTFKELREHYVNGEFPEGSMGPKILAALRFIEYGGEQVIISNIEQGWEALQGKTGTRITKK